MKVLYDHQTFTMQEYGGISRYMFELIRRFPAGDVQASVLYSNNVYLKHNGVNDVRPFFPGTSFKKKFQLLDFIDKRYSIKKIKQGGFDIFHPTYYDAYFLKYLNGKPFTATFHDMIHERLSSKYPVLANDRNIIQQKRILLEHAPKVISVSESTKRDLTELLGVSPSKIEVIHLASSINAAMENEPRMIAAPYLLFVGNRWLYKNFELLLEALSPILQQPRYADLQLVCAGGGEFSKHDHFLIGKQNLQGKVIYKPINDKVLVNLYKHAELFIFPSEYEGFGIPVVEAFACECPVALGNASSLPEVGGDAALYFDATSASDMRDKIEGALENESLRATLRKKGSERSKLFSWDKTYEKTIAFYKSLL